MTRVTAAQWVTAIISAIGLLGGVLGGISTLRSANAAAEKSEADRDEQQFARLERELARLGEALDAAPGAIVATSLPPSARSAVLPCATWMGSVEQPVMVAAISASRYL